jgi:2-dehydro-3-deoxyphosphogluconate aldolase/(4S)-4-hydroxy-2-oxoglutarate aldolase
VTAGTAPGARTDVVAAMRAARAIPVLRSPNADTAVAEARLLASGGLSVIEVTFSVPDTARVLRELSGDPAVIVGAGTVLTPQQATEAVLAGAQFLVSPVCPEWLLPLADELGVPAFPGAASPTEIWRAADAGAELIKVFPIARLGGAAYIRDLLAPMPDLKLMATGGVDVDSAQALLAAGCAAVGMGSILGNTSLGATPLERVRELVRRLAPIEDHPTPTTREERNTR